MKARWYVYYKCRSYNQRGTTICSHNHSMLEEDIISATLVTINIQIQSLIDIKELTTQINFQRQIDKKNIKSIINFDRMIDEKKKKIKQLKNLKELCYSDWIDNIIENREIKTLTREIAISLIDTIHVDQNKHLNIDFKFTNEYEKLKDYIYSIASAV